MKNKYIGRYGRMAIAHMEENHQDRLKELKSNNEFNSIFSNLDDEVYTRIWEMIDELIIKNPVPKTEGILERTRYLNNLKSVAEEIVLNEMVLVCH